MSDASTARMITAYMEEASAPLFLSGLFQTPETNFHTAEDVEVDIEREGRHIAIPITDLSQRARHNEASIFTNKRFKPPIYDEEGGIHSYDQVKRRPGQDPFQDPEYGANAMGEAFSIFRKLEKKIRRSIELQASQVLQTGVLTLTDQNGNAVYALDFEPKPEHFQTVGTTWATDGSTGTPIDDLVGLGDTITENGMLEPNQLVFGSSAWRRFEQSTQVRNLFDNRRYEFGTVRPEMRGQGASFKGRLWIGDYECDCWVYNGRYRDPQTGEPTRYLETDKVIMRASQGRLDLTYGGIPLLRRPVDGAMSFLPPRMSDGGRGLDMTVNAYFTEDNKHLMVQAGTRPLCIPTAIDTFGCLDVTA